MPVNADGTYSFTRSLSSDLDGVSNGPSELERALAESGGLDITDPRVQRKAKLAQLANRLVKIPYCPWEPTAKQRRFLLDFDREVLYGGAVGGAKSVALLMGALQFVDVPGYSALLLRKSFSDLEQPGALMPLADDWLRGKGPRWDQTTHSWHFPSTARITFGYIERENDRLKYQGAAYHYVGFDELTQHKERDYRYLFSRMRRPKVDLLAGVPIRMRSTTNPGGPGHDWVYRRFIKPWELWQAGKGPKPIRNFHPSFLSDNPHLDSDEYLEFLSELDPVTRAQLLKGDWNIRPEGRMFKERWFIIVGPDLPSLYDEYPTVRYWDLAGTDPNPDKDPDWTAGVKLTYLPDGTWLIRDVTRFRANPGRVEKIIWNTAVMDGYGVPIYIEQDPGQAGKAQIAHYRSVLAGFDFHGNLPSGKKEVRAMPVAAIADDDPNGTGVPEIGSGKFRMCVGAFNEPFLDEVGIFPDGFHDDQVDALSGAFQMLAKRVRSGMIHGHTAGSMADEELTSPSAWRIDE